MRKIMFLLTMFLVSLNSIYASDSNNIIFEECKYSSEYLKWDKLSNDEKSKVNPPFMCEIDLFNSSNNLKSINASYYNLKDLGKVSSVKNQKDTSTCWAFSALSCVESNLLMNNGPKLDLSAAHMELAYQTNFEMGYPVYSRKIDDGGNFNLASSYFLNGKGPVLETKYPFNNLLEIKNDPNKFDLNVYKSLKPYLSVGSAHLYIGNNALSGNDNYACTSNDINKIKSLLVDKGAVASSLFMTTDNKYLNQTTGAYHYNGVESPNHAITIVGWDDNYDFSSSGFTDVEKGAWIVKNSYGTSIFNEGYNYISYNTSNICSSVSWYTDVSINDNTIDRNTYYYDELFFNGYIQKNTNSLYIGTIFEKKSNKTEKLKQIKIGSVTPGDTYKVYFSNNDNFSDSILIAEGVIEDFGYTNVDITKDINITSSKYSITILLSNNNVVIIPTVTKTDSNASYSNLDVTRGVNFVGVTSNPSKWADITNDYQMMFTTKAVTEVVNQSTSTENPPVTEPDTPTTTKPQTPTTTQPEVPTTTKPDVLPEDEDKPSYDDGDKKEPSSSNNNVVIKPNEENNNVSYIEKTPDDVDNPKTLDSNISLIIFFIIFISILLVVGLKRIKKLI